MIPTTHAPIAAANLCTGYIPFDQAATACALTVILGSFLTILMYRIGLWLRKD